MYAAIASVAVRVQNAVVVGVGGAVLVGGVAVLVAFPPPPPPLLLLPGGGVEVAEPSEKVLSPGLYILASLI